MVLSRLVNPPRLRFDAFPYQRFGSYQGQVIKTAQAIVLPNEVDMPVTVQEPVYRVEVQLESQQIRAFNNDVPLQSGMLLSADIVLEQRSLLAWLFEPIFSPERQAVIFNILKERSYARVKF